MTHQKKLNELQIQEMETLLEQLHLLNKQSLTQIDKMQSISDEYDQARIDLKTEKIRQNSVRHEQFTLMS